jgi:XTP/dITP diphosphohydrolase
MKKIYIGSMNQKKAREMAELLAGLPLEVHALPQRGIAPVEENGVTFETNAQQKALGFAAQLKACVVADDSGLEVDALDKRPGVFSARYGGPDVTDERRCELILEELKDVPLTQRTARFRCFVAFAAPGKVLITAEDKVEGHINYAPAGEGGFGYDPIFIPLGFDRTFGKMTAEEKHKLSHRGKALRAFRRKLEEFLKTRAACCG